MLRRLRREDGQTLVLMMVAMPLVFGMMALVLDGSGLFVHRRAVQNNADATALAAAQSLNSLGGCTSSYPTPPNDCVDIVNRYYVQNYLQNGNQAPNPSTLVSCSVRPTNCYQAPYVDSSGVTHVGQVEIRLKQSVTTSFGGVLTSLLRSTGLGSLDVSARAVASLTDRPPPPLTFASLNNGGTNCENHTLVIRASGHLTVTADVHVNSCNGLGSSNGGDGFDVFGPGGSISAHDILVHGGWETHDGDDVIIPVNGTTCPLLKAGSNTPWQPGCPKVGQPLFGDPFAALEPPSISGAPVDSGTCTVGNPCYNTTEFSPACWLDASVGSTDLSLIADGTTPSACSPPGTPFYIGVDGERMKVTSKANAPSPPNLSGSKTLTFPATGGRGALGSVARAHNEPVLTITGMRSVSNIVTLTTSAPHNLNIGDWVRVNLVTPAATTYDGVFQVSEIPDDETSVNPVEFSYVIPGNAKPDIGGATIVKVSRLNGEATVTTSTASGLNPGDPVVVDITSGDDSFDETLEDGVTVDSVSPNGLSFSYAQPGLPDTAADIHQIGRFDGTTTIVTTQTHGLSNGDNAIIEFPPDASFNGTFPISLVSTTKFTYSNSGADVGYTVGGTQNVTSVARWNGVAWVTTGAGLGGLTDTSPTNRVDINLTGTDTSFNGTFDINGGSLQNGGKTFSYPNTGPDSTPGPAITATAVSSNAGGVATVTVQSTSTLAQGDQVIVNLSDSRFNNGGDPVTVTKVNNGTQFQYQSTVLSQASETVTGNVKLLGGTPPTGSKADRRSAGVLTVDGQGGTVKPYSEAASGIAGSGSASGSAIGPLFEIFNVNSTAVTATGPTTPFEHIVPAGSSEVLNPGVYYGGLCMGTPGGTSCGTKVGGSCTPSVGAATNVTMNPGIYIMAGGGFFVCGNTNLTAEGVMIYNTQDSQAPGLPLAAQLDQVKFNTNGTVDLTPVQTTIYKGMTIYQGPDPLATTANQNLELAPGVKCDGRALNLTDIYLAHVGTDPAHGLDGFQGTIYAPGQHALFNDSVSGTATLAVVTGCIFIDGATSTFNFDDGSGGGTHLFGIGADLTE